MSRRVDRTGFFAALAGLGTLLPGDHIHFTAPIHQENPNSDSRVQALEAAEKKRIRKLEKAKGHT